MEISKLPPEIIQIIYHNLIPIRIDTDVNDYGDGLIFSIKIKLNDKEIMNHDMTGKAHKKGINFSPDGYNIICKNDLINFIENIKKNKPTYIVLENNFGGSFLIRYNDNKLIVCIHVCGMRPFELYIDVNNLIIDDLYQFANNLDIYYQKCLEIKN